MNTIQKPVAASKFESFSAWTDNEINEYLFSNKVEIWRRLDDGEIIGVVKLSFTTSVCMGIHPVYPFKYRWCFANPQEAYIFFASAQEYDEIPTQRASLKGHRYLQKPLLVEYDEYGFTKW